MKSGSRGLCTEGKSLRIGRPAAKTFKFKFMTFYSVPLRGGLHIFDFCREGEGWRTLMLFTAQKICTNAYERGSANGATERQSLTVGTQTKNQASTD